ncbi:ral guanine nucleotide dissociation stimulator-like [Equus caballus]|uniref:ral guanine nucleotide dissociation stimulator-like n=1 Tax=Equus caballus TaxID=9796 RepID=UPI0038B2C7B3
MCSCIPSLRGSGAQRANNDSLLQRCRHWLRPHLQDLRPFGRRNPQSSTQEMVQELAHGSYGSISLDRGQVQQTTDLARGWTEGRRGESLGQRNEACRMRALQAGLLERLPPSIGPALAPRNMANVTTIVFDCAAVLTSHGVLDHLLATMRLASLRVIWPGSHLGGPAYLPQVQLQHQGPRRAELEAPVPELLPALEPEQGPAPGPEAAPAVVPPSAPELEAASPPAASPPAASPPSASPGPERAPSASAPVPASELEQDAPLTFGRSLPPAAEVTAEASAELREERPKLLDFPPKLVAEQLTRMDAELFKKVEPRHCLGFVWCQRPNGSKEYLAPTVRATINQFLHVSGCVITTCLGDLSMTAQDRARVVELWIQVAKECRVLGNYASLRAIVSALQSPSISRLQKTWGRVARKSSRKLKRFIKDQWVSRRQLVKEATSMLTSLETGPTGAQKGLIPFLGTFLNYLLLLDTNMEDYLEGNEINFEKRSEEFKVTEQIFLLQEAVHLYHIEAEERFGAWFEAMEPLSEDESYSLSCHLEPPQERAGKMRRFFLPKKNRASLSSGLVTRPLTQNPATVADPGPSNSSSAACSSAAGTRLGNTRGPRPAPPMLMGRRTF